MLVHITSRKHCRGSRALNLNTYTPTAVQNYYPISTSKQAIIITVPCNVWKPWISEPTRVPGTSTFMERDIDDSYQILNLTKKMHQILEKLPASKQDWRRRNEVAVPGNKKWRRWFLITNGISIGTKIQGKGQLAELNYSLLWLVVLSLSPFFLSWNFTMDGGCRLPGSGWRGLLFARS